MTTKASYIVLTFFCFSCVLGTTKRYWDLGVVIDKEEKLIVQKEIDMSTIKHIEDVSVHQEDIKAFRANNFIAPILHNLKYSTFNKSVSDINC